MKDEKTHLIIEPNITSKQLFHLKIFISNKPFSIIQCDKNIGTTILLHQLHDKLCFSHLEDTNTYLKLTENPINDTTNKIESTLNYLRSNGHLKIDINKLIVKNARVGKFRILAKLHKAKFGIRPIINNT